EMSFIDREDVIKVIEELTARIWKGVLGKEVSLPIPHMSYEEGMTRYGSDRPDLRWPMQLHDVTDIAHTTEFGVFKNAPQVKCIVVPGGSKLTRQETDALADWAKRSRAKGLAVTKVTGNGFDTGVAKFIQPVASQ